MPTPCNLKVAEYPGSSEKEGRENTSDVFEIEHHVHQPLDPTTGQATGVRQHSPMRIANMWTGDAGLQSAAPAEAQGSRADSPHRSDSARRRSITPSPSAPASSTCDRTCR
jgi:hypothetical protein